MRRSSNTIRNMIRTAYAWTNLANTLARTGWVLVCMSLWIAAISKVSEFDMWLRYVDEVTTFPKFVVQFLALTIPAAELAIPFMALFRRTFSLATLGAISLFCCFIVFHGVRFALGDPLSCNCFGQALHLTPGQFLLLDCLLLGASSAARNMATKRPDRILTKQRLGAVMSALLLLGVELRTTIAAIHPQDLAASLGINQATFDSDTPLLSKGSGPDLVVIFGDYQCPFTRKLLESSEWKRILADRKISVSWRELPLTSIHPRSMSLAYLSKKAVLSGDLARIQPDLLAMGDAPEPPRAANQLTVDEMVRVRTLVDADLALVKKIRLAATPLIFLIHQGKVTLQPDLHLALRLEGS